MDIIDELNALHRVVERLSWHVEIVDYCETDEERAAVKRAEETRPCTGLSDP